MTDFSVIIPAHNAEFTISRALESCVRQSCPPREIIVVDDFSSDQTVQVVEAFARRGNPARIDIRLLRQESNGGPARARNLGIRHAESTWIGFLDSDDEWDPQKLELTSRVIESRPDVALVAHRYASGPRGTGAGERLQGQRARSISLFRLLLGNIMQTSCVVMRRSGALFFNAGMSYSEDYELWLRVAATGRLEFLELKLTHLGRPQLSPGGLSSRRIRMRLGEMRAYFEAARIRKSVLFLMPMLLFYSAFRHLLSTIRYLLRVTA